MPDPQAVLETVTDPVNIALGFGGLTLSAGAVTAVAGAVPAIYSRSRRAMAEGQGAVTYGIREQYALDGLSKPPVFGLWKDRLMGVQFIAGSQRGKTQALLPLINQDLEAGRDVCFLETEGDFGPQAVAHARARGARVLIVDATDPEALALNPLFADSNDDAAQRAAKAISAVATESVHYSNMNDAFARNFTVLARDYKRSQGRDPNEATLSDVYDFALDIEYLKKTLRASIEADGDGERIARIEAKWLSRETARWFEKNYLPMRPDDRKRETSGFISYLYNLLSSPAAKACLCPEPGREVLNLAHELSDEAETATEPGQMGRLIAIRFPKSVFKGDSSEYAAYWALRIITDATRELRTTTSAPLALIIDELNTIIGRVSGNSLEDFKSYLVNVAKLGVAVHVSYQDWDLLPDDLDGGLRGAGANLFISGGMRGEAAVKTQKVLGSEMRTETETRREAGSGGIGAGPILGFFGKRYVGKRENEKPHYSIERITTLPRGYWFLKRVHDGDEQEPVIIRVPMAKMPASSSEEHPAQKRGKEGSIREHWGGGYGRDSSEQRTTPIARSEESGFSLASRRLPGERDDTEPVRPLADVLTNRRGGGG